MINTIRSHKVRSIVTLVLSLFNVLFFFAMRCLWSGTGKVLNSQALPVIFYVVIISIFIATLVLIILKKEGWYMWLLMGLSIFWIIGELAIIYLGGSGYLGFVFRSFGYELLVAILIYFLIYMIFYYPKSKFKDIKWLKITSFSAITVLTIYLCLNIHINYFTYKPVVYAVEENYQIVFSTRNYSKVYVTVGNENYYDTYAGSDNSETYIHKVTVPMSKLDSTKKYTINAQSVYYRGPFGGWTGPTISETKEFRPVDSSDGLKYYSVSDVHGAIDTAAKSSSYFGDDLDFFVMVGDIVSLLNNSEDCNAANALAYKVTNGEIPCVYARGNHEVKDQKANELYKYVGSKDENFYYYFKLGKVFGIVLDVGEDHEDDWWEYYDTAHYEEYRNKQIEWLNNIDPKLYEDSNYRMVVCHIPLIHINYRNNFSDFKKTITNSLNKMNIDIHLCGHQHEMIPFIPYEAEAYTKLTMKDGYKGDWLGGQLTDFNFLSMMVGKRSNSLERAADEFLTFEYSGLATNVDFNKMIETCSWTNSKMNKVVVGDPYSNNMDKEDYVFDLRNAGVQKV